jgi:hypothetical protein
MNATEKPKREKRSGGVKIANLCINRPVFATMLNLFLVALGWMSFKEIGVDQFPNVELPIVTVTTTLRGASPEEMETSVTKPLEEIINTIQGIDELTSVTLEGVSQITVTFLLERNRDIAAQDVRDKVNTILSRLPPGTDPAHHRQIRFGCDPGDFHQRQRAARPEGNHLHHRQIHQTEFGNSERRRLREHDWVAHARGSGVDRYGKAASLCRHD